MSNLSKLLPLLLAGVSLCAVDAKAQDSAPRSQPGDDTTIAEDAITVIGSRRPGRTVLESNVPVDVIGADQIEKAGYTDINRQLQALVPSFNYPQPSLVDGTEHIKPASLRGLAPDQTLVLINGKRRHPTSLLNINGSAGRGSVSVDLNAIPSAAIKQVEVLRDGAAAQYGSDAIAGVINIVTRDAPEGGRISVNVGMYVTTLDGVPEMTGIETDANGYPVANGTGRVKGIYGDDIKRRDGESITIAYNQGFNLNDKGFVNATFEYINANRTNRGGADDGDTYPLLANGQFDPRELTVNRNRFLYGNPETESYTGLLNARYDLGGDAEAYGTATFQHREATSGAFYREASDEGYGIQDIYPDGFTPLINSTIEDYAVQGGVRGKVAGWDYDLSAVWGTNKVTYLNTHTANTTYLDATPTEFYGGGTKFGQTTLNADFSREFDTGFLASPLSVSFGMEYRRENYEIFAGDERAYTNAYLLDADGNIVYDSSGAPLYGDSLLPVGSHSFAQGSIYYSDESAVDVARNAIGLYGELDANITDPWDVTLAGRYERYSDFGSTFNVKLATRYALTDSFALRASVSTGFRAPSLQQQYYTSISTNFINGVAYDIGTLPSTSAAAQALGGTPLKPEKSKNVSVGMTWNGVPDLVFTLDAYWIRIDDRIVLSETLGDDTDEAAIVAQVFASAGIEGIGATRFFINGVNSTTKGIDATATYSLGLGSLGKLDFVGGINWNKTQVSDVIATVGPASLFEPSQLFARRERARLENAAPRIKGNLSTTWSLGKVATTLRTSYYGKVTQPGTTTAGDLTVDPAFLFDLDIGVKLNDRIDFAIGSNNIFDKYPKSAVETAGVENAGQFDFISPYPGFSPYGFQGRYIYARLGYNF
ncbi:TonB-dependent receptor [Novosphingobium sp. 1949]|uniref:TonB-dependent receptor n=1 Tax=Novosphingobium organovorum TaxID=2930092 RepID=A0ABT0BC82_9SPHN|nr:TonB-dependent receptor [Novosphingobium organovorum]MCJ2182667.1 TonB-dependent receptor [Novosphingobium organovorum]